MVTNLTKLAAKKKKRLNSAGGKGKPTLKNLAGGKGKSTSDMNYFAAEYEPESKTATYIVSKKALKNKAFGDGGQVKEGETHDKSLYLYLKAEIRKKFTHANAAIGNGLKAYTSVGNKVGTASPEYIKEAFGTSVVRTLKNNIDVRASLEINNPPTLSPSHTGQAKLGQPRASTNITTNYKDSKGRGTAFFLRQDVDESVSRNQGGSNLKSNRLIKNQSGLNAWVNSTLGATDQQLTKRGMGGQAIKQYNVIFKNNDVGMD